MADHPRYPRDLDPMKLEPHFSRHMNSLTDERIDGKAAIAEQLALRDQQIEQLHSDLAAERALHLEVSRIYREEHERIAPLLAAAVAAEQQRQLAARLGETMCAGVVVTEPPGAPDRRCPKCGSINPALCERMQCLPDPGFKGAPQKPEGA